MKNLVWIASYPKSGNTWIRIFLTNLIRKNTSPANINDIEFTQIASNSQLLEKETGYTTEYLHQDEVECLYPEMFRRISDQSHSTRYFKVHDALTKNANGEWLFPPDVSQTVIYIIRNPLDIVVSAAFFDGRTDFQSRINNLSNQATTIARKSGRYKQQFPQRLLTWSEHVKSWTKNQSMPTHTFRYEDLVLNPIQTFTKLANSLGLEFSNTDLENAVHFSSFSTLKTQEQESGFRERPNSAQTFFREGKIGRWRNYLTDEQANSIVDQHTEVMSHFGYLDEQNRPFF